MYLIMLAKIKIGIKEKIYTAILKRKKLISMVDAG